MGEYKTTNVPAGGAKMIMKDGVLQVPENPIVPYIPGDGTGPDIWNASERVFDTAVDKAYGGKKKIYWMELEIGENAFNKGLGWLPDETVQAFKEFQPKRSKSDF